MKARLLERRSPFDRSFIAEKHTYPHFLKIWHYHPALELVYMVKSTGTRFLGDNIGQFQPGELILVGENLPHSWQNDDEYFEKDSELVAEAYVVHFRKDFAGETFINLPEMHAIKNMIDRARQGIIFRGKVQENAEKRMLEIIEANGFDRLQKLLQFLKDLADEPQSEVLSTRGFSLMFEQSGDDRIDTIYAFVMNNFKREINLEEVANMVNLNPTAFCRYFKKSTTKTFSRFLNEIRIGYSCKLLLEKKLNISEVSYDSGFNNLSNFNRQFKNIMDMSPSQYLRLHKRHG
jgi:AraC-like DNA-binding protein